MAPIIQVNNIAKKYQLNGPVQNYTTLRDHISGLFTRKNTPIAGPKDFWALNDVSFEVNEGEVLGIIGRNGAGKSTLLKVLSRITAPTRGEAILNGRVGSLLEVGTGFHPELSGRENIYFNGTILGMTKREITSHFDEIVDFSGIEKFIDTPIKRYSSGMQMRLAFSVAAHLDPEILIIDEVLAVGDADFRQKCINKMQNISSSNRTILFISHNSNAIQQLCTRCLLLKNGTVDEDSTDVSYVMSKYLQSWDTDFVHLWRRKEDDIDFEELTPIQLRMVDNDGEIIERPISGDEETFVEIRCDVKTKNANLVIGYAIYDSSHTMIYSSYHSDLHEGIRLGTGEKTLSCELPNNLLNDGEYTIQMISGIMHHHALLTCEDSPVQIRIRIEGNKRRSGLWNGMHQSALAPVLAWHAVDGC